MSVKHSDEGVYDAHATLRWRLWFVLGAVVVLTLAGKAALDERFRRAGQAQQAQRQQLEQRRERLVQAYRQLSLATTVADFESATGFIKPTRVLRGGSAWVYEDPMLNTIFTLTLERDGRVGGRSMHSGSVYVPSPQRYALEKWIWRLGTWLAPVVGNQFVPACLLLWGLIAAWGWWQPRQGREAALALVAWSMLCSLIWIASPTHSLTPKGVMSIDRLFWGVVMLMAAIPITQWLHARVPREWWLCPSCDYNLTGCASNTCPECGALIASAVLERLRA